MNRHPNSMTLPPLLDCLMNADSNPSTSTIPSTDPPAAENGPPAALAEIRIDAERIKNEVLELAEIGRDAESRGIYRMAFTDADMAGKRWLADRIEQAGLELRIDGAGNVCGLLPGDSESDATAERRQGPRLLVGSHTDTVPCAGALDGALGVLVALESLRRMREVGYRPPFSIELISFSDEEGRFGGMFGSEAVSGRLTLQRLRSATDLDGIRLWDAMQRVGLDPIAALDAQRDPNDLIGYLELHIEQGPVLDASRTPIGVVKDITGLFKWAVTLSGEANHAGTTPMDMRRDAFMGLADFAHEIPRILAENGSPMSRATIGRAQILPGSANTVPGLVEFSLDVRDISEEVLRELSLACRRALSAIARRRELKFDFEQQSWIVPVACDPAMTAHLEAAAGSLGLNYLVMPSGAAHDAQILGGVTPIAMLFVPSREGQSHSPAEWTNWHDIEAGANVFLQSLLRMSQPASPTHSPPPSDRQERSPQT